MSTQASFYGPHTEKKLQAIEGYLSTFLQVLSNFSFETIYVDAFAGSGSIPVEYGGDLFEGLEDARTIVEGSALRALRLDRKFSRYIFIEKDARKLAELKATIDRELNPGINVEYICGNASDEIAKLSPVLRRHNVRSVVFLDPFGSQVAWSTLEELAKTKHVDLWYLFPAGLSVNRQIPNHFRFTSEQRTSLDRLFGPHNWESEFIRMETVEDLFGPVETRTKSASIDDITRYMIRCMSTIFEGGVRKEWLPLGRDGAHWYSLIFAMANPKGQARKIGHDVAKHLLTKK